MQLDDCTFYRGDEFDGEENPRYSDRKHIQAQLEKLPSFELRSRAIAKYDLAYKEALADDSRHEIHRENHARATCNERLRNYVEALLHTHEPPRSE